MSEESKNKPKFLSRFLILMLCSLIIGIIAAILTLLGVIGNDKCYLRYESDGFAAEPESFTFSLKPRGNNTNLVPENNRWLDSNLEIQSTQYFEVKIAGKVKLCKAYLPKNNLEQDSELNASGKKIALPYIGDQLTEDINIILSATTSKWRNIAKIAPGEHVQIFLRKEEVRDKGTSSFVRSALQETNINADCSEGKVKYDAICGRVATLNSNDKYVANCRVTNKCEEDPSKCKYTNVEKPCPAPYKNDGSANVPWQDEWNIEAFNASGVPDYWKFLLSWGLVAQDQKPQCSSQENQEYIDGGIYQDNLRFWFSASDAAGLLYRFDSSEAPTSADIIGNKVKDDEEVSCDNTGKYKIARILNRSEGMYQTILDYINTSKSTCFLQYRFASDKAFNKNTGGYVFSVRQDACITYDGQGIKSMDDIGSLEYVILPKGQKPYNSNGASLYVQPLKLNYNGEAKVKSNANGILWFRVKNHTDKISQSSGEYELNIQIPEVKAKTKTVFDLGVTALMDSVKTKVGNAYSNIFQNMICYKSPDSLQASKCQDFFFYIKVVLVLYIVFLGFQFMTGSNHLTAYELVIRLIKIIIVGSLISGETFDFFNLYIFPIVTNFSDDIISSIVGYSFFSNSQTVSNPFFFARDVINNIFSWGFFVSAMAIIFSSWAGIFFFAMTIASCVILLIALFRAMATYLIAYVFIAALLAMAPIFLTFILFEQTKHFFNNWLNALVKYMVEPVILLIGIIILTQLFTIYLDDVAGYSVCNKCAVPFKIPSSKADGLPSAFTDVTLFCLKGFVKWGTEAGGDLGSNVAHMIALVIIANILYNFQHLAEQITSSLTNSGAPSAIKAGSKAVTNLKNAALKPFGLDDQTRARIRREQENIKTGGLKKRNDLLSKKKDNKASEDKAPQSKERDLAARTGADNKKDAEKSDSTNPASINADQKDQSTKISPKEDQAKARRRANSVSLKRSEPLIDTHQEKNKSKEESDLPLNESRNSNNAGKKE